MTLKQRLASRGYKALRAYASTKQTREDDHTNLIDLLTDLRHHFDQEAFEKALRISAMHHESETRHEEEV